MDYSRSSNIKARREYASNRKKLMNKVWVVVFRVFIALVLIGGFSAMGAAIGLYMGVINNAPKVEVTIRPERYTSIIYDSTGTTEIDRLKGEENRIYITSDKIPKNLKNAFIAIEDERFYQHDGIDVQGMLRAAKTMLDTRLGRTEGASTITQQIIKNTVNKLAKNTVITKLQEQYMAVQYEKELAIAYGGKQTAKDHILEVYINTILLGHGYYGAQTAAKNYFGKDAIDLSLSECAVIAAITQNPSKYAPDSKPENNKLRQKMVLDKMLELNFITQGEYDAAINDKVYDRISENEILLDETSSAHSYFIDALVSRLSEDIQEQKKVGAAEASDIIYNGGLKICATRDDRIQAIVDNAMLDNSYYPKELYRVDVQYLATVSNTITGKETNLQRKATLHSVEEVEAQVEQWKQEILKPNDKIIGERIFKIPQPQVGMTIIDYHTGYVKAIAGGRGDKTDDRMFNRAVDAVRQPGSVFKVLASYAPAIEMGKITPSTIIVDEPFSYNGHDFKNWWSSGYKGPQTVRSGIEQSMNILAVKNMVTTGIDECFKILERFHFSTLEPGRDVNGAYYTDKQPATALGGLTWGIKNYEITAAYGAIANNGYYNKPVFYTKVLDHDGHVIIDNDPKPEEILKKSTAYLLTDMMSGVLTNGTGKTARFRNIKMPQAGKTGTTSDSKDLYFVAYTPYYVCGIWTGYDQPEPMKTSNQHFHQDIWRDVMEEIHKDLEYKDFVQPGNVEVSYICQDSGKLATDFCRSDPRGSRVIETPQSAGNAPTDYCALHGMVTLCSQSNRKATSACPKRYNKVGIVVKDDYITDTSYQIASSVYNGGYCTKHTRIEYVEPVEEAPPEEGLDGAAAEGPAASGGNTSNPATPPEFQDTDRLPGTDSSQSADTPQIPSDWVEPAANPVLDALDPIADPSNPVLDEPAALDNFMP